MVLKTDDNGVYQVGETELARYQDLPLERQVGKTVDPPTAAAWRIDLIRRSGERRPRVSRNPLADKVPVRPGGRMPTYLLTWNPRRWDWDDLPKEAKRVQAGRAVSDRWSCARSHQIKEGARLFMLRQGAEPRGIFGSGWATSDAFPDVHWDRNSESQTSMYVELLFDALLDPDSEPILPRKDLDRGLLGHAHWDPQASGTQIPDVAAAELERVWDEFLGSRFRSVAPAGSVKATSEAVGKHGAGFGTPESNAAVERAAVELVAKTYRQTGWVVESVERDKCGFDLTCRKGKALREVEVKGIAGQVAAFLITAGEVTQAERNPRFMICVVTEALSDRARMSSYSGKQFLHLFTLNPIQFVARIRR